MASIGQSRLRQNCCRPFPGISFLKKQGRHLDLVIARVNAVRAPERTDGQSGFARATGTELGSIMRMRLAGAEFPLQNLADEVWVGFAFA